MRAAVLQGRSIEILQMPDPEVSEGRLLVAPIAAGICGSDLHLREQMGELSDTTPAGERANLPRIVPGHEFSATVVETGSGVDSVFRPGMIVTANPFTYGAEGPECVGLSPTFSGGIAELTLVDGIRAVTVPDGVPPHLAALTEPLAVGLHASRLASRVPGPNIVIGCGPVGLAVIFALRAAGRGPILAADFSASRRAAAAALGADIVVDPAENSPYQHWDELAFVESAASPLLEREFARPVAPNVFECVGAAGLIDQVMTSVPQHSHIIVVGVCAHQDSFVPLNGIQKELTVEFSFAYTMAEFRESLSSISAHPELAARFVTRELPLESAEAAFNALASNPEEVKILIRPQQQV
jgi:threonine dehydrogenase-like Zn-dependent dehydrogenase